jgi:hypothetical protein
VLGDAQGATTLRVEAIPRPSVLWKLVIVTLALTVVKVPKDALRPNLGVLYAGVWSGRPLNQTETKWSSELLQKVVCS